MSCSEHPENIKNLRISIGFPKISTFFPWVFHGAIDGQLQPPVKTHIGVRGIRGIAHGSFSYLGPRMGRMLQRRALCSLAVDAV